MRYAEHVEQHGTALFQRVCEMDLGGIVAKHSPGLRDGRSERRGSRSRTGTTRRWKAGRELFERERHRNLYPAGIVVNSRCAEAEHATAKLNSYRAIVMLESYAPTLRLPTVRTAERQFVQTVGWNVAAIHSAKSATTTM